MRSKHCIAIYTTASVLITAGGSFAGHLPVATGQVVFTDVGEVTVDVRTVNEPTTTQAVAALRLASQFCANLPRSEYVIDCYAAQLEDIARSLPKTGDYAQARALIAQTAARLNTVAREGASDALPRIRVKPGGGSPKPASRLLTAVATAQLPQASMKAVEILRETQTLLLRSTSNSDNRRSHYERIAQSMETGTILLRSL
ncbi:MAG: hypothetical protein ABJ327_21685 [Litoreibacter sp.]